MHLTLGSGGTGAPHPVAVALLLTGDICTSTPGSSLLKAFNLESASPITLSKLHISSQATAEDDQTTTLSERQLRLNVVPMCEFQGLSTPLVECLGKLVCQEQTREVVALDLAG